MLPRRGAPSILFCCAWPDERVRRLRPTTVARVGLPAANVTCRQAKHHFFFFLPAFFFDVFLFAAFLAVFFFAALRFFAMSITSFLDKILHHVGDVSKKILPSAQPPRP